MGDLLEMKPKVKATVVRFGCTFRVEYQAGRTPELSEPAAALYCEDSLIAWLTVGFSARDWKSIVFDMDDETHLVSPQMVGMSPTTEAEEDLRFLLDAEEYLLVVLAGALGKAIEAAVGPLEAPEASPEARDPRHLHPRERGRRALAAWHDHGRVEEMLPDLIAVEVYDAIEAMGMSLADTLDDDPDVPREGCGNLIRAMVEGAIQEWRGGEE